MSKIARFFATSVLVVSLSAVALADGGETQGPNLALPAPSSEGVTAPTETVTLVVEQDPLADLAIVLTVSLSLILQ
jgi:hypothetical protein